MKGLVNIIKKQNKNKPLKRPKTGLEVETHIIDNEGNISFEGLNIVEQVKAKYPEVDIVKECGKNMIELGCYPDVNTYNPALEMLRGLEKVIKVAKENNVKIYPFGTYPGKFETKFTPDITGQYGIKRKIFGREKFKLATKAVGFHHHYTLPKGVFDYEKKDLKLLIDSKLKRSLLNNYNFEIAIDPILTLFAQSSPFFNGRLLGKDSRMLIYRGGRKLGYDGLYSNYQQVGALPPYKQTETDLLSSIRRREQRWEKVVKKADKKANLKKMYKTKLDICWNPVKINKHGTLEQRGMDMNYMGVLLGISALIKFTLRKLQHDFIEVIPSDVGINEPFKIQHGVMFVPPHTYVRETLQRASAYEGWDNEELAEYAKKFYKFAKPLIRDFYYPLLERIEEMIEKRKSVSDEIISFAKRKKLLTKNNVISDKSARIIALHFSKKFEEDLRNTKKLLKEILRKHEEIISNENKRKKSNGKKVDEKKVNEQKKDEDGKNTNNVSDVNKGDIVNKETKNK